MMLQLTLPPNNSPTLELYTRETATLVGPAVPGTAVSGRPTLYDFDLDSLANGDYVVDINDPAGRFLLRKTSTDYLLATEWWQLECGFGSNSDPGKVLVNQDYGGPGALVYCLDGVPVADATIEVFLYVDYIIGKQDATYRVANSRQTVDGDWAMPLYLDPEIYVLRYYRTGVAGPDAYRVVVTFNPADIDITPINAVPSQITLGLHQPVKSNLAQPPKTYYSEPPAGSITVDHNYGGADNLVYRLNNKPVADAIIQIFTADDYEKKPADLLSIVASTRQNADGSWASAVHLMPGNYVLHCFKKNVAGPDSYHITVE